MRIRLLIILLALFTGLQAQDDNLTSRKAVHSDGYPFWVYTPKDYRQYQQTTPLIIFLHGASLRGTDLNKVLRYGPLDAVKMGLDIPAIIVAPQNPKGHWDVRKLNDILEWMRKNYVFNPQRVYVLGMSLGGYGTLDFAGTYPDKIAAAIALCGGSTLRNYQGLGQLPLWIIHGTADKAVKIEESQKVVDGMRKIGADERLRYEWIQGASHGDLARYFYLTDTYDWLFQHTLIEPRRPVDNNVQITPEEKASAYKRIKKR
ncbi:MAG: prolyl oligopeptidase family serine peptidase [Prevotella sp.]|nr:prolyl oligopeptidase family serine peptidase [Prevotella sp.]